MPSISMLLPSRISAAIINPQQSKPNLKQFRSNNICQFFFSTGYETEIEQFVDPSDG